MQNFKVWLVGILGSTMLRLFRLTLRLRIEDPSGSLKYAASFPIVGAFWHGHQLMMPWLYLEGFPGKPVYVLISRSQDGRFIAKVIEMLGIGSIAGSSSRGGTEALLHINRVVKEGAHVVFTPDGPKGPIYKAKSGAILAASNTGAPLVPTALAASSSWTFGSWDKMFLPKPFSKVVMYVGEKIEVPAGISDAEVETYQLKLEKALTDVSALAKHML